MGSKAYRGKSSAARKKANREKLFRRLMKNAANKGLKTPKSLVVLCNKAIIKYGLMPEPKKFTPPETFSVVGGKPLRKRSEKTPPELLKKEKKKKKESEPKSLATLCQLVIDEYNIIPECEETARPSTSKLLIEKKKKGRPRKPPTNLKKTKEPKGPRGRPRKDAVRKEAEDAANKLEEYTTFLQRSQDLRKIKVEQELNLPVETDPLQNEESFTVMIKEECFEEEDVEPFREVPIFDATASRGIVINPASSMGIPGPSSRTEPMPKYVTVVMDEYQVFANSIAEQLRALPQNRALLLQLDIQSMIDNEKQLLQHES